MVALALVAVLFGPEINGTRRWFGVAGIGVQPSELAKLAAIFFTAALLERAHGAHQRRPARSRRRSALVAGALVGLILLEPDFGTAFIAAADRRA